MNILEIYKKYQIMPQLAEHQLRVAAVGELICADWYRGMTRNLTRNDAEAVIDRHNIVAACLLHDMGNIIKFDLEKAQNLLNRKIDIAHWQKVKDEYIKKYGGDEHIASILICKEIGVNPRVIELVDVIGFLTAALNAKGEDFGKKICQYADDRVGPLGVISLEERFMDLRKRYQNHKNNTQIRVDFENSLRQIEKQIFGHCNIKPEDITEETITDRKERLKGFDI